MPTGATSTPTPDRKRPAGLDQISAYRLPAGGVLLVNVLRPDAGSCAAQLAADRAQLKGSTKPGRVKQLTAGKRTILYTETVQGQSMAKLPGLTTGMATAKMCAGADQLLMVVYAAKQAELPATTEPMMAAILGSYQPPR